MASEPLGGPTPVAQEYPVKRPSAQAPDPVEVESACLGPFWRWSSVYGVVLGVAAAAGPSLCDGDLRAAWLAGVPCSIVLSAAWVGRRARYRRMAMIAVTASAGLLGLATISAVLRFWEVPPGPLTYQAIGWLTSAVTLIAAIPAWSRAARARLEAEACRELYEEL